MLEIQELTKKYGKNLAVDHVSLVIPDGKVGILLGPNGAGKSTIIKSVAGLLRYEGGVGIAGIPARNLEAKKVFGVLAQLGERSAGSRKVKGSSPLYSTKLKHPGFLSRMFFLIIYFIYYIM